MKNTHRISFFRFSPALFKLDMMLKLSFLLLALVQNTQGNNILQDSTIRRLVNTNRMYVNMDISGPRRYESLIPLIDAFDGIKDLKLKADAAYVLGHYFLHVFDAENSLNYFSKSAALYEQTNQWGLYLNVMKDYCNACRFAGNFKIIEPTLRKCLNVPKMQHVGFYILDPLQELAVHLSFTEGRYSDAIKYGHMFLDTLDKYKKIEIHNPDFEYSTTVDAKIVELELGHSYLEMKNFSKAEGFLRSAEAFFLPRNDNEKLSRIYRHLAVLSGYRNQIDSVVSHLHKFDHYRTVHARERNNIIFKLPRLTRDLYTLNQAYLKSQKEVEQLTRQNYYMLALFVLTIIFAVLAFWMQRNAKLNQTRINELLRRDFERSQELNEEKTKYFSILSHELRTPIFAITGLAKLMVDPACNTKENVDAIINSGNHLLHLVNNVLQHNKMEESHDMAHEEVDFELVQTCNEVLQTISYQASQKNIKVLFNNNLDETQFLNGDKQKLSQILVNLISNAIRYSHRDGKIEVSASIKAFDDFNTRFRFSIRDYGVGIDEAQKSSLFDYRKTTYDAKSEGSDHLKGMGIGLFVVANFIASLGSEISVESTPGEGSNFYFDLTFKRSKPTQAPPKALQKAKKDVSILVVDDIKINLIVTQKTLTSIGVNCITATDADPVVQMIMEQNIDLVLMDLNMPLINGYDLSKKIREAGLSVPIIAHTAVIKQNIDIKALNEANIYDYLIKPYPIEELKEKLTQHLNLSFEDRK